MQKPNKLLEREVKDEFGWDPMLDATRIVVNVDDGKVTLTGVVPTYDETVRADQDASRVGGIAPVDNQLMVETIGSAIADEDVAADCVVSLDIDKVVPRGAVQVVVTRMGHFERRGSSPSPAGRCSAGDTTCARSGRVDGLHHIHPRTDTKRRGPPD